MVVTRQMLADMENGLNGENSQGTGASGQGREAPQGATEKESEAVAIRRLELEFELRRAQLQIESEERIALRRAELGHENGRPSSSGSETDDQRHAGLDPVAQCAKVLKGYRLPCDADVPLWFDEVERLFTTYQVPDGSRVHLIMPVLTERVRYLLRSLGQDDCLDYESVKRAVLSELKLTPAEYLDRFDRAAKRKDETWAQFASRVRTYFTYYLQVRGADTKETVTELMVADRIKASLSTDGLEYVRLREGENWLKPVEVARVLQTYEQAKGKGRATKQEHVPAEQSGTGRSPGFKGSMNSGRAAVRCHVCHEQGHIAKHCPCASGRDVPQRPANLPKPKGQADRALTVQVEVGRSISETGRSKLQMVQLACGDVYTEAVLDTGTEITVVRESLLPQDLREPSGTVKLVSAFGHAIQAKLATLPIRLSSPGAVENPTKTDLVCALTDQLAEGVNCLLAGEDWELLKAQSSKAQVQREGRWRAPPGVGDS
ncbi:uncharacterized protein LOC120850130 [Ixodes scapularis]|uniref:uncharacterized protein LOC120850130 n=1 Tax=Ixodes scapularis TaxID=6945 RepID=UPI001A9ED721|nr:uncharacterized protein LOC120850130 [Ixodes scapularis]